MKKKLLSLVLIATVALSIVACGQEKTNTQENTENVEATEVVESEEEALPKLDLEDGEYQVTFTTDSTMFHINDTLNDMATLTVKDGVGTVHITLTSKNIVNLYSGLAADAESDEANWIQPTTDEVTYEDGTTEEVNGFDVIVPVLDEEFDLALFGTKGTWYDHKVVVSSPIANEE